MCVTLVFLSGMVHNYYGAVSCIGKPQVKSRFYSSVLIPLTLHKLQHHNNCELGFTRYMLCDVYTDHCGTPPLRCVRPMTRLVLWDCGASQWS